MSQEKPKYTERDLIVAQELSGIKTVIESYLEKDKEWKEKADKQIEKMERTQRRHTRLFILISGALGGAALGVKKFILSLFPW